MLQLIDQVAIPWLDAVDTREKLVARINPQSATDRFGNRTADKIFGRNLLFRDKVQPISPLDFRAQVHRPAGGFAARLIQAAGRLNPLRRRN